MEQAQIVREGEGASDVDGLPFVDGPVPSSFERRVVEIGPGRSRTFDAADWRDALVVVERGRLDLECTAGGRRSFGTGSVLCLVGLPLRALHNPDSAPTVLVAVSRTPEEGRTMATEPRILDEPAQPYVAIQASVTMSTFAGIADRLPEIFGWLADREIAPAGAPFFRFHLIDMDRELVVDAGVPVAEGVQGEGEIRADVLPAGRYATVHHVGHPDELVDVATELLRWGTERGVAWDVTDTGHGARWGCRVERYLTDPREEPDMSRWEVELAFRLAGVG